MQEKADTNHSDNDDDDEEDDDGEAFLKKMMNDPSDNEEDKEGGATDASKESFPHSEVVFDNHEILPKGYERVHISKSWNDGVNCKTPFNEAAVMEILPPSLFS